jgi:RNA recognition motif-containing protein
LLLSVAFITFESANDAKKSLEEIKGKEINGEKVFVNYASESETEDGYDETPPVKRQKSVTATPKNETLKRKKRLRRKAKKHY